MSTTTRRSHRARLRGLAVAAVSLGLLAGALPAALADFHSAPPATAVQINDHQSALRMDLFGYPNYGVKDAAADVLYSGEANSWTFSVPPIATSTGTPLLASAELRVRLVLDDHYASPRADYQGTIAVNGVPFFSGPLGQLGLKHGRPYGSVFTNWTTVRIPLTMPLAPSVVVSIANTTAGPAGDWIAIDAINLRMATR
jgi:hypothetical protein